MLDSSLSSFLAATPLFKYADEGCLARAAQILETSRRPVGDLILQEGEPGDSLYLLKSGRLRVSARDAQGNAVFLSYIDPGGSVGETTLLYGGRRTATVHADTDCELLELTRKQFEQLQTAHPTDAEQIGRSIDERFQQNQMYNALRVSRLLGDLDEALLRDLAAELERKVLRSGEVLLTEGEPSDAMYIIISGGVRVVAENENGPARHLADLRRGQTIGETSIITGEPRTATVYAIRDSVVARLPTAGFRRLLEKYPHAITEQIFARVVRRLEGQVRGVAPAENVIKTIAVVSLDDALPLTGFVRDLAAALAPLGSTLPIHSAGVDAELSRPGLSQAADDGPAGGLLQRWLADQENQHDFLLYEADRELNAWTQRCLRQADHILLVGNGTSAPQTDRIAALLNALPHTRAETRRSLVLLQPPEVKTPSGTLAWLQATGVEAHYHVSQGSPAHLARLARLVTGNGIGVVLGGGGARGYVHLGALRALTEAGLPIDLVGGTSAGAVMACQYAMNWDAATLKARNDHTVNYRFDYTLPITALMGGGGLTDGMQAMFGDMRIEDMWLPCFCVTTSLLEGEVRIHERGPAWKYTRASSSIPGIVPPVNDDQMLLVDGGILNNLPTEAMRRRSDVRTVIALEVTVPQAPETRLEYRYESRLSGWRVLWNRLNPFTQNLPVPTIAQIMMNITMLGNQQTMRKARNLADFHMTLSAGDHGLLDFKAYAEIMKIGYHAARQTLAEWQQDPTFLALLSTPRSEIDMPQPAGSPTSRTSTSAQALPPLLKGLPFLGNTLEGLRNVVGMLIRGTEELGPVFRITRMGKQVYVLSGPKAGPFFMEHEEEYLTVHGVYDNMLHEGADISSAASDSHSPGNGRKSHTFIGLEGSEHQHLRRQLQHGFSRQQIAAQVPELIRYVRQAAEAWPDGHVFDAMAALSGLLMEQAGRSMLHYRMPPEDADMIGEFCKPFVGVGAGIQPELLLRRGSYRRGKDRLARHLAQVYATHRKEPAGQDRAFDLMDTALSATYLNGEPLSPEDVIGNSFYPYVMSSVYTNRTTAYLLYELLNKPDAMARVMAEVDAAYAEGEIGLTTLQRMPVMRAAIKEALRLYPLFPGVPRFVKKAFEFEGYEIPVGQKVYVAASVSHFNAELFPDPHRFDLDRFLPPRNEHHQPRAYAPFGLGSHSCLGSNLTEVYIQITLLGVLGAVTLAVSPPDYVAKTVANPLPGPAGMKLRVTGRRTQPSRPSGDVLAEEDRTLLLAALHLDGAAQNSLVEQVRKQRFAAGEIILRQGDPADHFYLLAGGAVEVLLEQPGQPAAPLARLEAGSFFGEIGLLQGVPRTATVRVSAEGPAEVLVIDRDTFGRLVAEHDLTAAEIAAMVRQRLITRNLAQALPALGPDQAAALIPNTTIRQFAPGEAIIRQGEPAETFYILTQGRVEVVNTLHSGQEVLLNRLERGEYFGEIGLLRNQPRVATVRAGEEPVEVLAIGREAFFSMMQGSHRTEVALAQAMAERLTALAARE